MGSWAITCMLRHMGFRVFFVRGDISETEPEKALEVVKASSASTKTLITLVTLALGHIQRR